MFEFPNLPYSFFLMLSTLMLFAVLGGLAVGKALWLVERNRARKALVMLKARGEVYRVWRLRKAMREAGML